jgi:hypothetical protein
MKAKLLLLVLLVALMTNGSSCINEGFIVPVNLKINPCYNINSGPIGPFGGIQTVYPVNLIDESFAENIKGARYYDIQVTGNGSYAGGNVVGVVYVSLNGGAEQPLLLLGGGASHATPVPYSSFATPQSLLGTSPYVGTSAGGVAILTNALNQLSTNPNTYITLRAAGQVSGTAPVPSGLSVCIAVLAQADASLNNP